MTVATLSAALRDGTKSLHTQAERSGAMAQLLRGQLSLAGYARLIAALHEIYTALERGLDEHAMDPVLAGVRTPGLARRAALESDLAVLVRLGAPMPAPIPQAQSYARHLDALARERPALLLAHAWLRYLGDLNGGRILERIVREKLGVPTDAMAFYRFPALADVPAPPWRGAQDWMPRR
jgi:heme oxygenase (biliverdin-producing, ferredoxin)